MVFLSEVVERHQGELERWHGDQLLPSHRQALGALRRCRRQGSDPMILECYNCKRTIKVPHLTKAPFNWTATADSILEKLQRLC